MTNAQLVSMMLCVSSYASGVLAGDLSPQQRVVRAIAEIRGAWTSDLAARAAERLDDLTSGMKPGDINEQTGSDLISLLEFPNEAVQYWAALSLGKLGVTKSIPALLKMLPVTDCVNGSVTAGDGVRAALEQLGHPPPPKSCAHPKHPVPAMNGDSKP